MKKRATLIAVFAFILITQETLAQSLPAGIKTYLNRTYAGWRLSPSEKGCGPETNNGIIKGNFNEDRRMDFAVKFTRGNRGYILAFLAVKGGYRSFVLHNTDAEEINNTSLSVWGKGDRYQLGDADLYVRFDAPTDFHCESDVGGIHLYRKGKFIAY